MPASPAPDRDGAQLQAGRVGRAHGLDGSFYVTGAKPRLLGVGTAVTLAGRTAPILRRAGTEQRPIVRIEGVSDRPSVEALRGMTLVVEAGQAPVLGREEWWAHELEGCEVRDGERVLGTVERIIELPSCEALEVGDGTAGPTVLVPMVRDAIRSVDLPRRRIEVDLDFLGVEAGAPERPRPGPAP